MSPSGPDTDLGVNVSTSVSLAALVRAKTFCVAFTV